VRRRRRICVSAIACLLLLVAGSARASLITIVMTGSVFEVDDPSGQLGISVGDTYTATVTIEASTPSSPTYGDLPGQIDVVYGTHHYAEDLRIFWADTTDPDTFASLYFESDAGSPLPVTTISIFFYDLATPSSVDPATAAEVPWSADWGFRELALHHVGAGGQESAFDSLITTLTVVPEPSTALLMALGLAALRGRGARPS
jgi:PEP-CTERM motif